MNGLLENWGILWPLPTISMLVVMRARSIKRTKKWCFIRMTKRRLWLLRCHHMQIRAGGFSSQHWIPSLVLASFSSQTRRQTFTTGQFHDSIQVDPGFMLLRFSQCSYATNRSHWMEHPWAMSWSTPASKSLEAMGIQAELLQHHHEQQEELTANMHLQVNQWGSHVKKSVINVY